MSRSSLHKRQEKLAVSNQQSAVSHGTTELIADC